MTQTWGDLSSAINVNELTKKVRLAAQPMMAYSQATTPPTGQALGLGKGDTGQYTYAPNVDTEGGQLTETEEMPSTGLTPVKATFTIAEYGNSIKYTGKLKDLSRLDLEDVHIESLMNDYQKALNTASRTAAITTDYNISLSAAEREFVTNGTPTVTTDKDIGLADLGYIVKNARNKNIPFWDGESYLLVLHPFSIENLATDSTLSTLLSRDSGRAALNNEFGRVKQCRIVEDNHKSTAITGTIYDGVLFGADAVVREDALPIEIRREDKDFGRFVGLAWYSLFSAFKVLDQTLHSQENCIYITSA